MLGKIKSRLRGWLREGELGLSDAEPFSYSFVVAERRKSSFLVPFNVVEDSLVLTLNGLTLSEGHDYALKTTMPGRLTSVEFLDEAAPVYEDLVSCRGLYRLPEEP